MHLANQNTPYERCYTTGVATLRGPDWMGPLDKQNLHLVGNALLASCSLNRQHFAGCSRYGKLWWGFPGSERKYHPHHGFFRKKEGIQKLFLVWLVFNLCTTEYQGVCSHQSKRCYIKLMRACGRLSEQATWSATPPWNTLGREWPWRMFLTIA